MMRSLAVVATLLSLAVACSEKKKSETTKTEASPNAGLLPAPLASAGELTGVVGGHPAEAVTEGIPADSAGRLIFHDPDPPPPEPAAVDRPMPDDALSARDGIGFTLEGTWQWSDVPAPASVPELAPQAIRQALQNTELRVTVDLGSTGRMRLSFDSPAFPLPTHTELRARSSYYGHVLVWPTGMTYRVLAPGSLRAMFAERRADVASLMRAKLTTSGTGSLLGHKTTLTTIETSLGALTLEQTTISGSGSGGELLCRLLVELVGADPATDACRTDRVPLAARYRWTPTGSISFVATSLVERKDLSLGSLYTPPAGAAFTSGELPPQASGVFLTQGDLAQFRTRPVRGAPPGPHAPGEGVTAENLTSSLQYLLLDGVAVAWVKPRERQYVIGPPSGRYTVSFRDFFGTSVSPPTALDLPALVRVGSSDVDAGSK